jgi:alkanesulfonate monooxygenase SsuD/methylene tetrahydromethanopterin reductase-like flavin-dependent oxidoreductase (luciferase family)
MVFVVRIGIGLPNPIPGCPGDLLPQWAIAAEQRGFSSLATIDRIAFPNHDSLVALAASAAVTQRIGLVTNILLLPTRGAIVVAKEAASVAAISNGRLTLGIGVGGREDDFVASDTEYGDRGKRTDEMLDVMIQAWAGEPVGGSPEPVVPEVPGGTIPLLIGGYGDAGVQRTVRYGVGWTSGGMPPDAVAPMVQQVRSAWAEAGREGEPRIVCLTYFSLGDEVTDSSMTYLRRYYGQMGDAAEYIAAGALRSPEAIRQACAAYAEAGVDELMIDPTVADLDQVHRLADVIL